ncbi:MAG: type II secretion system protein [Candidatus Omnitrophica bacterium]|nr:type II secretion system protein [Candidatus Omnitrophota bacterium]
MAHKPRAFTFIELILVVIILSVLTAVSLPRIKSAFLSFELNNFSGRLETFIGYLCQRAASEGQIIYLSFDNAGKEYRAQIKGSQEKAQAYKIPAGITVETEQKEIAFYPDATTDKVDIIIKNSLDKSITLTTKGVYSGVKAKN